MPEGDTIVRFARRLRDDLEGHRLTELRVRHRGSIQSARGLRLDSITTHGKNTLLHFGDSALHVHLGMNGNWRRHQSGSPIPTGITQPAAVLETKRAQWRCNKAMHADVLEGASIRTHPRLVNLGPCLLARPVNLEEIISRARRKQHQRSPIADLLLVQSVAAGIGTIYRSESLFVARQSPWAPVVALSDQRIGEIYSIASTLLFAGVEGTRRAELGDSVVRSPQRSARSTNWVYTRANQPCRVCNLAIEVRRHSDQGRKTYYCRHCQIDEPRKRRRSDSATRS